MLFAEDVFLYALLVTLRTVQNPTRYRFAIFLLLTWLSLAGASYALSVRDSVAYRDTTIYDTRIEPHLPISLTLAAGAGFVRYSDNSALMPSTISGGCDTFTRGNGTSPYIAAGVLLPLSNELQIHPTLAYRSLVADHVFGQFAPAVADTGGGSRTVRSIQFDHTISAATKMLSADLLLRWQPTERVILEGGPTVGLFFDQSFTKTVHRVTPGALLDSVEASGTLPNAHTIEAAFALRAGYEVPLSHTLFAMPNVAALLPLGGTTDYFKFYSIEAGVTFRFQLASHADTIREAHTERVPVHIEIPEQPSVKPFAVGIEAFADGPNGLREQVARLEVREVKARNAFPLLNYVFFDSSDATIPARYVRYKSPDDAARNFRGSMERRGERTTELYLETLNIIGDRLKRMPQLTIKLVGSTSNIGAEADNAPLGKRRAEAVRDYLVRIWGIEPSRIAVVGRTLPEKPSPSGTPLGQAENRRVEILPSDDRLTDPLYVTNIEHTANPPQLHVVPTWPEADTNVDYHISIRIGGQEIQRFDGNSEQANTQTKDWTITEEALSSGADSLEIRLDANTQTGNAGSARTAIKLEQHRIELNEEQKLDRFSLILFNFDESSLTQKNERILGLVADALKRIKPRRVIIRGYTDEMGDDEHNLKLSTERATAAADRLRGELRKRGAELPAGTIVEGRGSHEQLYDNSFPEGRFLSRTVMVTIER